MRNISIFWKFFSEVLNSIKGEKDYTFNPKNFMVDANGADFSGVAEVHGTEDLVKTVMCHWQLKDVEAGLLRSIYHHNRG